MDLSAFDSDATVAEFLDEARGNVEAVSSRLLLAERGGLPAEGINEIFRGAHSLKGLAGMFNLGQVCELTHALETVFDRIRKGRMGFTAAVVAAAFAACDALVGLLDDIAARSDRTRDHGELIHRLVALAADGPAPAPARPAFTAWDGVTESVQRVFCGLDLDAVALSADGRRPWLLRLPMRELHRRGRDLVLIHRELTRAVEVVSLQPVQRAPASPWQPIAAFDYQVVALVIAAEDLAAALTPLCLPRCDAWRLDLERRRGERVILEPQPERAPSSDGATLAIRPDMAEHRDTWLAETGEELEELDGVLIALERDGEDQAQVQAAFRLAHRIKGSAGAMGLEPLARAAHNLEWLLDLLRSGRANADPGVLQPLFALQDFLRACVGRVAAGSTEVPDHAAIDALLAARRAAAAPQPGTVRLVRASHWEVPTVAVAAALAAAAAGGGAVWRATVELRSDVTLPDLRCQLILSHVRRIATIAASRPAEDALAAGIERLASFHLLLTSTAGEQALRDALQVDAVLGCELERLTPPVPAACESEPVAPPVEASAAAPALERRSAPLPPPAPEPIRPAAAEAPAPAAGALIRVEAARLDRLLDTAGELVIAKARIAGLAETLQRGLGAQALDDLAGVVAAARERGSAGDDRLDRIARWLDGMAGLRTAAGSLGEAAAGLHRTAGAIQGGVMQLRMVPVAPLFQRFQRVVRDLCRDLGKDVRLVTAGEATELDKKLIDDLVDPLTHLVRNALDHGVEDPAGRTAAGKPAQAEVRLEALQEGGRICIRISDDGRGIDHRIIRAKAVEKGLLTAAEADALDERAAVELIFLPGFSTAKQVTNVSGRGVGMDIVRARIAELKGTVEIATAPGRGAAFTIRLPLTLAMIDALLVEVGGERLALPLDAVREIVDIPAGSIRGVDGGGEMLLLRGRAIALVDLSASIGLGRTGRSGTVRAVVAKGGREPVAIPVDRVLREEEIVVKPLPIEFAGVRGFAGTSVLGDGGVALILDVPTATAPRPAAMREAADARA